MVAAVGDGVLGRDEELLALRGFLADVASLPAAFLIEGEAGIGKTTLWLDGLRVGRERSYRVLASRPAGSETELSYAALRDLLEDAFAEVAGELPAPQRLALAVALLLEEPTGAPPGQGAVAAGFLGVLRLLARAGPVLVAADDLHWLDAPSLGVLRFAARRLGDAPVAFLLALRLTDEERAAVGLERAFPEERLRLLRVGPLSLGACHSLLHRRLGRPFPRPLLRRLHATAGGNPFFALELAQALERGGIEPELGAPLPVPGSLRELLRERLQALPRAVTETLLAAAALSSPTLPVLERASGARGEATANLEAAAVAGVVLLEGDRVRFSHPLLASAVYSAAGPAERRALHRRLAPLILDPEERARHLALAAEEPDAEVAAALHEAAGRARARGAPGAAAELVEQASRLTPPENADGVLGRMLEAAGLYVEAGDTARGRALVETAAASSSPGPQRAEALTRLARVHLFEADNRSAARLYREALAEADAKSSVRADAEVGLAVALMRMLDNLPAAARHARKAAELAQRLGEPRDAAEFLGDEALILGLLGRPGAATVMEQAVELEEAAGDPLAPSSRFLGGLRGPRFLRAVLLLWTDRLDEARALLVSAYERAAEIGDEGSLPLLLRYLGSVEWLAGRWEEAERWVEEGQDAAVQTGQASQHAVLLASRSLVEAGRGRVELARTWASEALALSGDTAAMFGTVLARSALGLLELSLGNPAATNEQLGPLVERLEAAGLREPGAARFFPDQIEALIALGKLDEAEALLDRLERRARRLDRVSALASSCRCRGLLAAARGELPAAVAAQERALHHHSRVPIPFERARTLLAYGSTLRRTKQKRAAREALERALVVFERLDAALWAQKARAELGRIGGRAPASGELTPTEERVAALVAEGRTTKEVAAELFVSVKTVEGHLSRIYAKLGVRSRTELARRFGARLTSAQRS
jgi:DNA-binding CsgD family transcriptional regulator